MALALASAGCAARMEPVLPRLAEQLREAIAAPRSRRGVNCPEALQVRFDSCTAKLSLSWARARALG